jgi:hypothetical protein
MLLSNAIGELIELVDEIADIDTAHGICLGERHSLRKPLPME